MFWDWMSCYQNYFPNTSSPPDSYEHLTDADKIMRTKKQDLCFKNALKSMNDWYVSKKTTKLIQSLPPPKEFGVLPYINRGWCRYEYLVSSWTTPPEMLLDLGYVFSLMEEWDCANLGEMREKHGEHGSEDTPTYWFDFVKNGEINLASSRHDPPLTPEHFSQHILPKLIFTNGKVDSDFVEMKYKQSFEEVFSSGITEFDFQELGWSFDVADLINGAFRSCAETITYLNLMDNDLTGNIEIFKKLEYVNVLYLSNNRRLVGDISSFASLDKSISLRLRGCEKLVGDRDQLKADLPNCRIYF